jgi:hypothetical protein
MRFALPLFLLLVLVGCDSGGVNGPLPTFDELRDAYREQELGIGLVREGSTYRRGGYMVETEYLLFEVGTQRQAHIDLNRVNSLIGIGIILPLNVGLEDLQPGMELDASFTYGGEGDSKSGVGRFYVTAVDSTRVAGVFAADLVSSGLVPSDLRVTGAVNATVQ